MSNDLWDKKYQELTALVIKLTEEEDELSAILRKAEEKYEDAKYKFSDCMHCINNINHELKQMRKEIKWMKNYLKLWKF